MQVLLLIVTIPALHSKLIYNFSEYTFKILRQKLTIQDPYYIQRSPRWSNCLKTISYAFPNYHVHLKPNLINLLTLDWRKKTSTMGVDPWYLKVKDIQSTISSITRTCCITVCMQNFSSIYLFILIINHILETHDLKDHAYFWPCPP